MSPGFIKFIRDSDAFDELIKDNRAYCLLSVIAKRARRTDTFNPNGLEIGEALIGDYQNYGMTRQQYRTALKKLEKWQFSTIRTTNKGTIAKLINSDIFDINQDDINHHPNHQATIKQPTANHQATTNKNVKNEKNENNGKNIYGEFVLLTVQEYERLKADFGDENLKKMISKLDNYLGADKKRLKKYSSHNHVIRGWVADGMGLQKEKPNKFLEALNERKNRDD